MIGECCHCRLIFAQRRAESREYREVSREVSREQRTEGWDREQRAESREQ
jgi:hypothetical protein